MTRVCGPLRESSQHAAEITGREIECQMSGERNQQQVREIVNTLVWMLLQNWRAKPAKISAVTVNFLILFSCKPA